jgi:hypothetical protein
MAEEQVPCPEAIQLKLRNLRLFWRSETRLLVYFQSKNLEIHNSQSKSPAAGAHFIDLIIERDYSLPVSRSCLELV